jgi:amino acid transporter
LEGGLVGALVLYGVPVMPATAAVLVYHTIAFWIPSIGGVIAYVLTTLGRRAGGSARKPCEGRTHPAGVRGPARERVAAAPVAEVS